MTIWKFPIELADEQTILMPQKAEILCLQVQAGQPCIWALVNELAPRIKHAIFTYGTGHPIENVNYLNYIGTYQLHGGGLIFHVFDYKK